jgi:hypothetical protein
MNQAQEQNLHNLNKELLEIRTIIQGLAQQQQGNSQGLLLLLRTLEHLHREIREQLFEPSLPNMRRELYNFLRDMEETGGWPYIERMRLKALVTHLFPETIEHPVSPSASESDGKITPPNLESED